MSGWGVKSHLWNAKYLSSMKPFSEGDWILRVPLKNTFFFVQHPKPNLPTETQIFSWRMNFRKAFFARHIFSAATLFLGMCGQPRPPVQLKIGVGATRCLLGGVTVKTHRGEALEEVASGASFFSTKKWWVGSSGWFTRDCQGHGTPLYGKRDPYYSHTIPISLGIL